MTIRHLGVLLLVVSVPVALIAGTFLERATSVVSPAIQPYLMTTETDRDRARGSELDQIKSDLRHRIELKNMLVSELLAGRRGLADVTAQFLSLNQAHEEYMSVIHTQYSGATDTEKTARNVIGYAAINLGDCGPIQRAMILARLECELCEMETCKSQ
ncbi:MAG: hypothetical protein U0792_14445 [Gemmataceae bacterium]